MPFPSPRDLPDPGIEPGSPAFQADVLTSEPPGKERPLKHALKNQLSNYFIPTELYTCGALPKCKSRSQSITSTEVASLVAQTVKSLPTVQETQV